MRKLVIAALAAVTLAAPAAIASARGNDHRAKGPRTVEYEFRGVVTADASTVAVDLTDVRGRSKHARRALAGASTITIKLDANTRFKGRRGLNGTQVKLSAGDRVRVVIRAVKGLVAADLPAATLVSDRGPAPGTAIVPVVPPPAPPVAVTDPPVLFL